MDAAELCCPVIDTNFGVAAAAIGRNWIYHFPGWHEPTANAQFLLNQNVYNKLTAKEQEIVKRAMDEAAHETDLIINNKNRIALQGLIGAGVRIHEFPDSLLDDLRNATERVIYTRLRSIPDFSNLSRRVIDSMLLFTDEMSEYGRLSEGAYYRTRD